MSRYACNVISSKLLDPDKTALRTLSCLAVLCMIYLSKSRGGLVQAGPWPGKSIVGSRERILSNPEMYEFILPSEEGTRIVPITTQLSPLTIPVSPTRHMCPGQCPGVSMTLHVLTPLGPFNENESPSSILDDVPSCDMALKVIELAQIGAS